MSGGAAWLDYDNDGWLDLFVVNYVNWSPAREITCFSGGNERDYCHPSNYNAPATNVLYHNSGDGCFRDVTCSAGIAKIKGSGLGIAHGDFNGDGRMDFYIANDGDPNRLWINNGDGTFSDQGLLSGSAVNRQGMAEAGMGVMAVDIEDDGDLDLFMTHLRDETNTLYRNQQGSFEDITTKTRLSASSIRFTGFGAGFADFDHDGVLDLYVANGRVGKAQKALADDPFAEPNQLFQGLGNSRFKEISPQGGTLHTFIENSRATAFGDYDNDGDIDILVVNNGGPSRLLENIVGDRKNWIVFRVINRYGRDAIGANVRITTSASSQWRQVQSAYSYQSSHDPRIHFGLDEANEVQNILVVWPGGQNEAFGRLPAGAVHLLREGAGKTVITKKESIHSR